MNDEEDKSQAIGAFDFGDGFVPAHRHPNGGGWVADTAIVAPTVYVGPDARVFGSAEVSGSVQVRDSARVFGSALVFESAQVSGSSRVFGHAEVFERARVFGRAQVSGVAEVCGSAQVFGDARVWGDALVFGGKWSKSPFYIEGSWYSVNMCAPGMLAIGCQVHSIEHWLACGREIGREYGYTEAQLEEYERYIRLAAEMCSGESGGNG